MEGSFSGAADCGRIAYVAIDRHLGTRAAFVVSLDIIGNVHKRGYSHTWIMSKGPAERKFAALCERYSA